MRVMVIVKATKESEAGALPSTELLTKMGKYNEELAKAGLLLAADGLRPSSRGKRVKFSGTVHVITDGPFAETEELIAGYWVWRVQSIDEAVEWLKRAPFDAGDGYTLATAIDDVVDYTEQAAAQLDLYGVEAPMEQAVEFADVLVAAGAEILGALRCLHGGGDLSAHLVEIHRLENVGDRLQRDAVTSLFAGGIDPMVVIRWKDIFESLEAAVDACETVAHVLEGITLKRRRR